MTGADHCRDWRTESSRAVIPLTPPPIIIRTDIMYSIHFIVRPKTVSANSSVRISQVCCKKKQKSLNIMVIAFRIKHRVLFKNNCYQYDALKISRKFPISIMKHVLFYQSTLKFVFLFIFLFLFYTT